MFSLLTRTSCAKYSCQCRHFVPLQAAAFNPTLYNYSALFVCDFNVTNLTACVSHSQLVHTNPAAYTRWFIQNPSNDLLSDR